MISMALHNTTPIQLTALLYTASMPVSKWEHPSAKQQDRGAGRKTQVHVHAIPLERCPETATSAYISLIQT